MTTIEKPRSAEQIKERAYGVPNDLTSKTGYCTSYNHKRCPYRPGGACENGIALSDGGFYMCPCDCHAEQKAAKRTEPEWSGLKGTDSPNYSGPITNPPLDKLREVVSEAAANGQAIEAVEAKAERPAKSPKAPKAPKPTEPKPAPTKLGNAEKQAVRYAMAAILRDAFNDDQTVQGLYEQTGIEDMNLVVAYLEDHWLQYIDPDKDKARREAAAAARKAK